MELCFLLKILYYHSTAMELDGNTMEFTCFKHGMKLNYHGKAGNDCPITGFAFI